MLYEYKIILILIFISFILGIFLFLLSYILIYRVLNFDKLLSYECGFEPFEDARTMYDVKFYLIGILFIIFDLEIVFLFPWVLILFNLNILGFFSMYFFLFILILAFIYEWILGALDW